MKMSSFETGINVRLDALDKFLSQVRPVGCWQKKGLFKKLIYRCRHGGSLSHDQHNGNILNASIQAARSSFVVLGWRSG